MSLELEELTEEDTFRTIDFLAAFLVLGFIVDFSFGAYAIEARDVAGYATFFGRLTEALRFFGFSSSELKISTGLPLLAARVFDSRAGVDA